MSNISLVAAPNSLTFVAVPITGFSALLGSLSGEATVDDSFIYQTIIIPPSASTVTLDLKYWPKSSDGLPYDFQEAQVQNSSGGLLQQLFKVCDDTQAWTDFSADLSAYVGQVIRIYLNIHQNGAGDPTAAFWGPVSVKADG